MRAAPVIAVSVAIAVALAVFGFSGGCTSSTAAPAATPTPAPSFAGASEIQHALELGAKGQLAGAADELAKGQRLLEEACGLRIQNLTVVSGEVLGYGAYTPLTPPKLSIGKKEPLVLYFEPACFARTAKGGLYTSDLSAGVAAYAPAISTEPFLKDLDFISRRAFTSRQPNREILMTAKLHIKGPPPGQYLAEVLLTDHIANKTTVARVPFELVP